MNCACAGRSSKLEKRLTRLKKKKRLQVAEAAMAVNEGARVAKNDF